METHMTLSSVWEILRLIPQTDNLLTDVLHSEATELAIVEGD